MVDIGPEVEMVTCSGPNCDVSWNSDIFNSNKKLIDDIAPHSNIMGFIVAKANFSNTTNPSGLAIAKAAVRDTKAYLKGRFSRDKLIGVRTWDTPFNSEFVMPYLNSGNVSESVDFFTIRATLCDGKPGNMGSSYGAYGVPILMDGNLCQSTNSELGFAAIYGPVLSPIISGGFLASLYTTGNSNYGYGM